MSRARPSPTLAAALCLALAALACGGGGSAPDGGGPVAPTPPAAPTGLLATATSSTSVAVTWTPPAGELTGYELERAEGGGAFARVATPPADASGYGDGGLATGTTYRYRLRAVGPGGASGWSAEASATPVGAAPTAPAPPGGLQVVALGTSAARLDWIDQSDDETGFEIERAPSAAGPFGQVGTAAADAQTWSDAGLSAGTAYHYRVRAVNAAGPSAFTSVASVTTSPAAPAVPTGVLARATSSTGVAVTWTPPAGQLTGYELERAEGGGAFARVATPPADASGYGDGGLATGTTYRYRLRAVGPGGASGWSAEASATPMGAAPSAPFPPGGLLVMTLSATALLVDWVDQSDDETGFEIERATSAAGPFGQVGTAAADAQTWSDAGLSAGTTYHYRVRAVNAAGPSAFTSVASATTSQAAAPADPTGVAAVQELSGSSVTIRVTWTDAATGETGYEVQRSPDGAAWGEVQSLPANVVSYVDPAPLALATNHYRVRAVSGASASAWVQTSIYNGAMLIGVICPAVTGTTATALAYTSARVGWTWNICGGVGIERSTSPSGPWSEVARLGNYVFGAPPDATWDDTGLAPGTTYHYRLRALPLFAPSPVGGGTWTPSGYGDVLTVATPAAVGAPTGLAASDVTGTTATLTWTAASGADGYAIDYATAAAGPFGEAFRVGPSPASAGVSGMTPGTTYWFRVRALKDGTSSAPSNVVTFTTASTIVLRTSGDAFVMASTALSANQDVNVSDDFDSVGCFFTWLVGPSGQALYHNCAFTALRFDTAPLAGRTVTRASLVMWPCGLAPHPVSDATYAVWALMGPWDPATVTFNTIPDGYAEGSWVLPAPTAGGAQTWDVTSIVRAWVAGTWAQHGLVVGQSPIVDRIPTWGGQQWDNQDQVTSYCSLERTGGSIDYAPALHVEVR